MPASFSLSTTEVRKSRCSATTHPADEVSASGASGTKVTCEGLAISTKLIKSSLG